MHVTIRIVHNNFKIVYYVELLLTFHSECIKPSLSKVGGKISNLLNSLVKLYLF